MLFPIKLGNPCPYLAIPSRRPFSSMQRCQRNLPRVVPASAVGFVIHELNFLFLNSKPSNALSPRLIANDQTVKRISQDFSPVADFEARRMTKEDFPGRYPYRDYGLRFWDATHTWVKEFLDVSCSFAPYRDSHRFWIVPVILVCLIAFESIDPADVPSWIIFAIDARASISYTSLTCRNCRNRLNCVNCLTVINCLTVPLTRVLAVVHPCTFDEPRLELARLSSCITRARRTSLPTTSSRCEPVLVWEDAVYGAVGIPVGGGRGIDTQHVLAP